MMMKTFKAGTKDGTHLKKLCRTWYETGDRYLLLKCYLSLMVLAAFIVRWLGETSKRFLVMAMCMLMLCILCLRWCFEKDKACVNACFIFCLRWCFENITACVIGCLLLIWAMLILFYERLREKWQNVQAIRNRSSM